MPTRINAKPLEIKYKGSLLKKINHCIVLFKDRSFIG